MLVRKKCLSIAGGLVLVVLLSSCGRRWDHDDSPVSAPTAAETEKEKEKETKKRKAVAHSCPKCSAPSCPQVDQKVRAEKLNKIDHAIAELEAEGVSARERFRLMRVARLLLNTKLSEDLQKLCFDDAFNEENENKEKEKECINAIREKEKFLK